MTELQGHEDRLEISADSGVFVRSRAEGSHGRSRVGGSAVQHPHSAREQGATNRTHGISSGDRRLCKHDDFPASFCGINQCVDLGFEVGYLLVRVRHPEPCWRRVQPCVPSRLPASSGLTTWPSPNGPCRSPVSVRCACGSGPQPSTTVTCWWSKGAIIQNSACR